MNGDILPPLPPVPDTSVTGPMQVEVLFPTSPFGGVVVQMPTRDAFLVKLPAAIGPTGPPGELGPQGAIGSTGPPGATGATGATGAAGPQGLTGTQGNPGAPGSDSTVPGPQGPQGPIGASGPKGATGNPGTTGPQGAPGSTGPQGIQGTTGPTGPKGADGTSVVIKGTVANHAALPPTGNTPGDLYITLDTGHGWVWGLPGQWSDVGPIQGPPGATGAAGATGAQGPAGATGVQGLKGDPGATGATGPSGPAGTQGIQGTKGDTGATGATGSQGIQGIQGIPGPTGSTGSTGATGAIGPQGAAGATGPQGATGPGVPTGGTAGQILVKQSGTNFDTVFKTPARLQTVAVNPAGTTVTSGVMAGLGSASRITPAMTGNVLVTIAGNLKNDTLNDGAFAQISYGTGAAPLNGAGGTGTLLGSVATRSGAGWTGSMVAPFSLTAVITGLALGVPVWLDLVFAPLIGGTATVGNVAVSAIEF